MWGGAFAVITEHCALCDSLKEYKCWYCNTNICEKTDCPNGKKTPIDSSESDIFSCDNCIADLQLRKFDDTTLLNSLLARVGMKRETLIEATRADNLSKQHLIKMNFSVRDLLNELETNMSSKQLYSGPIANVRTLPITPQIPLKNLFPLVLLTDHVGDDILVNIFKFLDFKDLLNCFTIAVQWSKLPYVLIRAGAHHKNFLAHIQSLRDKTAERLVQFYEQLDVIEVKSRLESESQLTWMGVILLVRRAGVAYCEPICYDIVLQRIVGFLEDFFATFCEDESVITVDVICKRCKEIEEACKKDHQVYTLLHSLLNEWEETSNEEPEDDKEQCDSFSTEDIAPFDVETEPFPSNYDLLKKKMLSLNAVDQVRLAQTKPSNCIFRQAFYNLVHYLFPQLKFTEKALQTLLEQVDYFIINWVEKALLAELLMRSMVLTASNLQLADKLYCKRLCTQYQHSNALQEPPKKRARHTDPDVKELLSLFQTCDSLAQRFELIHLNSREACKCSECPSTGEFECKLAMTFLKQDNCHTVTPSVLSLLHTFIKSTIDVGAWGPIDRLLTNAFVTRRYEHGYWVCLPQLDEDGQSDSSEFTVNEEELNASYSDDSSSEESNSDDDDEPQGPFYESTDLEALPCYSFYSDLPLKFKENKQLIKVHHFTRELLRLSIRCARIVMEQYGDVVLHHKHFYIAQTLLGRRNDDIFNTHNEFEL